MTDVILLIFKVYVLIERHNVRNVWLWRHSQAIWGVMAMPYAYRYR